MCSLGYHGLAKAQWDFRNRLRFPVPGRDAADRGVIKRLGGRGPSHLAPRWGNRRADPPISPARVWILGDHHPQAAIRAVRCRRWGNHQGDPPSWDFPDPNREIEFGIPRSGQEQMWKGEPA